MTDTNNLAPSYDKMPPKQYSGYYGDVASTRPATQTENGFKMQKRVARHSGTAPVFLTVLQPNCQPSLYDDREDLSFRILAPIDPPFLLLPKKKRAYGRARFNDSPCLPGHTIRTPRTLLRRRERKGMIPSLYYERCCNLIPRSE